MNLTLKTAPETEPVSEAEAKVHLKVDHTDDDTYINTLIEVARLHAEELTQRGFITQTWELRLDWFPHQIDLLRPPVISVTSVKYIDEDGAEQTLAADQYTLDKFKEPGRLVEEFDQTWPTTREVPNAVIVEYIVGYGAATAVPDTIKQAILFLIAHWYEQREAIIIGTIVAETPDTFEALLGPFRIIRFP